MSEKTERREDDSSVRVALRIRPQLARERIDMCQICTAVMPEENQVMLGKDKAFTFDHVYDIPGTQEHIYNDSVRKLIDGCFEGYNATVFAYGQTGSGKTYTMGTGFDVNIPETEIGIIPRAVDHLFSGIEQRKQEAISNNQPVPDFKVNAQFMELYNEEILDLMDTTRDAETKGRKSNVKIHEDAEGGIYVVGVATRLVHSLQETIQCLQTGALSRSTASTNMNATSSRSHAIFTLHIKQHRVVKEEESVEREEGTEDGGEQPASLSEFETLTAKFHFVDLAGSERLKRTGATGDRAKEGISINCGLLALGNVISALGDKLKKGSHVPYRDSKLTRLLQDSLGGNSRTLMIACVSPSDRDFMETLNTLKYANRARNIKNKVIANQDKASKQLAILRQEIQLLQQELLDFKSGRRVVDSEGGEQNSDLYHENTMLQTENDKLRTRIKSLNETVDRLTTRNSEILADKAVLELGNAAGDPASDEVAKLIQGYVKELEELRAKLAESESMVDAVKRARPMSSRMGLSPISPVGGLRQSFELPLSPDNTMSSILEEAKRDVKKLKRMKRSTSRMSEAGSDKENVHSDEEKVKNEVANDREMDVEEKDKLERPEKDDILDENGNEEQMNGDYEEEDDDIEDEITSESDTDSEGKDSDNIHEDLAELTCEISIKQRLIEELETTQRRLQAMKSQYDEKIQQLTTKIRETETERDKVLSSLGQVDKLTSDQSKKIKEQFERKLNDMQNELKKFKAAQKEHAKLVKNQSHYEKQLKTLQHELGEMKKTKVKLMKQIKEDTEKNKQAELRRGREVAQLRKEQLKKEGLIRNLEKEKRQKDVVLRRKQEEVESLRRRNRPMSSKTAGRVGRYDRPTTIPMEKETTRLQIFENAGLDLEETPSTRFVESTSICENINLKTNGVILDKTAKFKQANIKDDDLMIHKRNVKNLQAIFEGLNKTREGCCSSYFDGDIFNYYNRSDAYSEDVIVDIAEGTVKRLVSVFLANSDEITVERNRELESENKSVVPSSDSRILRRDESHDIENKRQRIDRYPWPSYIVVLPDELEKYITLGCSEKLTTDRIFHRYSRGALEGDSDEIVEEIHVSNFEEANKISTVNLPKHTLDNTVNATSIYLCSESGIIGLSVSNYLETLIHEAKLPYNNALFWCMWKSVQDIMAPVLNCSQACLLELILEALCCSPFTELHFKEKNTVSERHTDVISLNSHLISVQLNCNELLSLSRNKQLMHKNSLGHKFTCLDIRLANIGEGSSDTHFSPDLIHTQKKQLILLGTASDNQSAFRLAKTRLSFGQSECTLVKRGKQTGCTVAKFDDLTILHKVGPDIYHACGMAYEGKVCESGSIVTSVHHVVCTLKRVKEDRYLQNRPALLSEILKENFDGDKDDDLEDDSETDYLIGQCGISKASNENTSQSYYTRHGIDSLNDNLFEKVKNQAEEANNEIKETKNQTKSGCLQAEVEQDSNFICEEGNSGNDSSRPVVQLSTVFRETHLMPDNDLKSEPVALNMIEAQLSFDNTECYTRVDGESSDIDYLSFVEPPALFEEDHDLKSEPVALNMVEAQLSFDNSECYRVDGESSDIDYLSLVEPPALFEEDHDLKSEPVSLNMVEAQLSFSHSEYSRDMEGDSDSEIELPSVNVNKQFWDYYEQSDCDPNKNPHLYSSCLPYLLSNMSSFFPQ